MLTLGFGDAAVLMLSTLVILLTGFCVAKAGLMDDTIKTSLVYIGTSIMVFAAGASVCLLLTLLFIL